MIHRVARGLLGMALVASVAVSCETSSTDGVTSGSGGAGGAGATCPGALLDCGGVCVDGRLDRDHCGACGTVCEADQVCSEGKCGFECTGGTTKCELPSSGEPDAPVEVGCVDTKVDSQNCGACGNACSADQVCSNGECADDCNGGTSACEGVSGTICVNTQNDEQHCGACDVACEDGKTCVAGACETVCVGGSTLCQVDGKDLCIDVANNPDHCGACGSACDAGKVCQAGECVTSCLGGTTKCQDSDQNDVCVKTAIDPEHCGACGNACDDGKVCQGGQCVTDCVGGTEKCENENGKDVCVTLPKDPDYCGACETSCVEGKVCQGGLCVTDCVGGTSKCTDNDGDDVCVNLQKDAEHCGACDTICADGEACQAGKCVTVCAGATTKCVDAFLNDVCVVTSSDPFNCGACGNECAEGEVCAAGQCVLTCLEGTTKCGDACVDTTIDLQHCGGCNKACAADEVCAAGKCASTCAGGTQKCGNECVNTSVDAVHCGGCGNACAAGETCVAGVCDLVCEGGTTKCGNQCVDTLLDLANCGACGNACAAGESCVVGVCDLVCAGGTTKCGNQCVDTSKDVANCGACGNACGAGKLCVAGACQLNCVGGKTKCDDQCVDLAQDTSHCGGCGVECTEDEVCTDGTCALGKFVKMTSGSFHACALLENGRVKCWGLNNYGQLGLGDTVPRGDGPNEMGGSLPYVKLGTGVVAVDIEANSNHTCIRTADGRIKCWGRNDLGQLGLGDTNNRGDAANEMGDNLPFLDLGEGKVVADIGVGGSESGQSHTCALLVGGTVKCWGSSAHGQLGLGDTLTRGDGPNEMGDKLPEVSLGTNLVPVQVTAAATHTCVRFDNGRLKCWGRNNVGQLCIGNTAQKGDGPNEMGDNLPLINLGTNLLAATVFGAGSHTCAILTDGRVKCWGYNNVGQLGIGTDNYMGHTAATTGNGLPFTYLGEGKVAKPGGIFGGDYHTCAILTDNTLKCWGNNGAGQLGLGHTANRGDDAGEMKNLGAVPVGTNLYPVGMGLGRSHTCAFLNNATVKCWGKNDVGQLGLGDTTNRGDNANEMGDLLPAVKLFP